MYVFVDIGIDVDHLAACMRLTFGPGTRLAMACIIQFAAALHVRAFLNRHIGAC
jgi:hypothetical protein